MDRRGILTTSAVVAFTLTLFQGYGLAQQKTLKEQLAGTWSLVSFDSFDGSGAKIPNMEGRDLKGLMVFTDSGRMSVQMITEFPKLASNDRMKTTPAEEKAVGNGILSDFGISTVRVLDQEI